jgi:aminoglycoside/choline kinase family phosphotransferase
VEVDQHVGLQLVELALALRLGVERFERGYWALAAQRNTRILGVFTRLWKRDSKPHYRQFQPRMWGLLERDLAQPNLEPVRAWFDANVGPEHRREPWQEAA